MIYKAFFGRHIDLSKLVAVSDAYFIDRMGSGGYYVGFQLTFQLMDEPMNVVLDLTQEENPESTHLLITDGTIHTGSFPPHNETTIQAVANLQKQIDGLIKVWKSCSAQPQTKDKKQDGLL